MNTQLAKRGYQRLCIAAIAVAVLGIMVYFLFAGLLVDRRTHLLTVEIVLWVLAANVATFLILIGLYRIARWVYWGFKE